MVCHLSICVPLAVHGFSTEARFGQLFHGCHLTIAVGGRGGSASFLKVVEARFGFGLHSAEFLGQK